MNCCRALALCLPALLCLSGSAAGPKGEPKYALTPAEQKYFEATNRERVKNNVPALKLNLVLCKIARAHSQNMAKQNKLAHELDGLNQFGRIKGAGYRYRYAAENVARGNSETNLDDMIAGLLKSPLHRKNFLNKDYTEIGVGIAYDGKDFTYYTQDFAKPKSPAGAE